MAWSLSFLLAATANFYADCFLIPIPVCWNSQLSSFNPFRWFGWACKDRGWTISLQAMWRSKFYVAEIRANGSRGISRSRLYLIPCKRKGSYIYVHAQRMRRTGRDETWVTRFSYFQMRLRNQLRVSAHPVFKHGSARALNASPKSRLRVILQWPNVNCYIDESALSIPREDRMFQIWQFHIWNNLPSK